MTPIRAQEVEATTGFEPVNRGFADLSIVPFLPAMPSWDDSKRLFPTARAVTKRLPKTSTIARSTRPGAGFCTPRKGRGRSVDRRRPQ